MNNTPDIKLGIVAGSTDWLPLDIASENRRKLLETYKETYGKECIYECSIVITDNEVNIKRAMREVTKAECNAVVLYWAEHKLWTGVCWYTFCPRIRWSYHDDCSCRRRRRTLCS